MNFYSVDHVGDTARIRIFGEILAADDFLRDLRDASRVELFLNCPGGDLRASLAIYRELCQRETVAIIQRAHSGGAIIAMSAKRREIFDDGSMMVHAPQVFILGGPTELRAEASRLSELCGPLVDIFVEHTGRPAAVIKRWLKQDSFFTPSEAVENGLADAIIPSVTLEMLTPGDASRPARSPKEILLLDMLRAFGPVETSDRAKLFRELSLWFQSNVS